MSDTHINITIIFTNDFVKLNLLPKTKPNIKKYK